jgi:small subunit ribosomal protein S20
MAQHKSAKKRIRQTARRTEVNRARVSKVRTSIKKVETAIARKSVLHRNTAARKVSRLAARVKALSK